MSVEILSKDLIKRRTKILATVGPASSTPETLEALILAGVDVFRLNFSHGTHEGHAQLYARIRQVSEALGRHVAILADMCGPKIRCGLFENGVIELVAGEVVTITTRPVEGRPGLIPSEYEALSQDVTVGDRLLLDDGKLELRVQGVEGLDVRCEVVRGGPLRDRKGINLPGVNVSAPALTDKDRVDAVFAADLGVDFMALSFVRRASDVTQLRDLLRAHGHALPIISKIEKPEALLEIEAILTASAGIMVARGDLGVEMPAEQVPLIQRELTGRAIERNRLVIVATQMLESMITSPHPTRAEVTDVAWAAMAGADAVMLSGETAAGAHPVEAVATMDRVLRLVEGNQWMRDQFEHLVDHTTSARDEATVELQLAEALSRGAATLAREVRARAIIVRSLTGFTAQMISAERPAAPIISLSAEPATCRRLALAWGVVPCHASTEALSDLNALALREAREMGLAEPGQFVLVVIGGSPELESHAPTLRLLMV